ncbi:uncharacterized protein LOC123877483 [Maniola jurtina]|uniref:uncharacterized protein LOC123877483 n=1 Tax=Maniola jurtina TaxID=191418 RepID=UPI001E68A5AA|nr:uncharacterized protein LOC123877483 [Maniola jurtina]
MSYPPPYGPPPPPYYGPGWRPPHPPSHSGTGPQQPNLSGSTSQHQPDYGQATHQPYPYGYPYYVPGAVMMPFPVGPPPDPSNPTYITNIIYQGETSNPPSTEQVQISETDGDYDWVPTTSTTANNLTGKAVIGGHEGWDGSPLWVIRAWHNGDLLPGKLSVRHNAASVMYNGKEIPVQKIDVLCAKPESLRWVPASNGSVPPGAIPGGRTSTGETLYVGRARHQLSVTPGKIHPSHGSCYIGFGGAEVAHKMYDVLCRVS